MMSCGWLWLYAGALLMFLELLAPGFVVFFFGLSAASVGLLWFALGDAFTLTGQLAAFSVLSVVYIVLLRRFLKSLFSGRTEDAGANIESSSVGRIAKVTEAINPPLAGRVELGDAEWSAVADRTLAVGTDVKIVAQQNLTMKVEPLSVS